MRQLAEVVDFEVLLARDEDLAAREGGAALLVRDRALAGRIGARSPHARLAAWAALRASAETEIPGHRARGAVHLTGSLLALGGAIGGGSAAAALLAYDGRAPVNVLAWLLYVCGLPLALAGLLVLGLIVPSRWLPRAGAAQALLAAVLEPLLRRLPSGARWARRLFGRSAGRAAALQRWLLVGLTQIFTVGFLVAAIGVLLVKVAITDLTFAWSTTLDLSDGQVSALVRGVGAPWQAVLPDAVPSTEAVARSNYRRFVERFRDTEQRTPVDVRIGATWWKWAALAAAVYGLLPRLLLLVFAAWRYRVALARWPALDRPDVAALLARFEEAGGAFSARRAQRSSPSAEAPVPPGDQGHPTTPVAPVSEATIERPGLAVAWGAAAADPELAARALGAPPDAILGAGTDLDLAAEQAVLSAAAERGGPVAVLMPLTEPPIEDVLGFLRELRSVAPRVMLVPLEPAQEGWRAAQANEGWTRALARVRGVEAHGG